MHFDFIFLFLILLNFKKMLSFFIPVYIFTSCSPFEQLYSLLLHLHFFILFYVLPSLYFSIPSYHFIIFLEPTIISFFIRFDHILSSSSFQAFHPVILYSLNISGKLSRSFPCQCFLNLASRCCHIAESLPQILVLPGFQLLKTLIFDIPLF